MQSTIGNFTFTPTSIDGVVIVDDIDRAQCFRGFGTVVIGKHERNLSSEKVP